MVKRAKRSVIAVHVGASLGLRTSQVLLTEGHMVFPNELRFPRLLQNDKLDVSELFLKVHNPIKKSVCTNVCMFVCERMSFLMLRFSLEAHSVTA